MLFVLLVISLGFIGLTLLVHLSPVPAIDLMFSKEIQEHQNAFIDQAMSIISSPGYMPESVIMIAATSLLFLLFKYRKAALYVLFTALSGLVSTVVKSLINRPRPSKNLVHVLHETAQQSFPSGHVLFYVVFFGFLILLMIQLEHLSKAVRYTVGFVSLFLIFSIPISRIYLGAHWFTDVVGGFLLGLLCLYMLSWLYLRKPANKSEAPLPETR
jgi:membrane-associated phospholipid phosphatase